MATGKAVNSTPLQKSLSRRVSFNEATLAKPPAKPPSETNSDIEAQPTRRPRRGCTAVCNNCCAWVSLLIGVLIILALLIGGIYFAFLQSNLPEFRLQRLDVNRLNVNNTRDDTLLTTDFEVRLNATNRNSNIELSYGALSANIMSEGLDLGHVKIPTLRQRAQTTSEVRVRTSVNRMPVEEAAGKDLNDKSKEHLMVIDVVLKGHIDFLYNGNKMNGFPFSVACRSIDQSEIDNGRAPRCSVNMNPFY